jgi:hypothetical protein
MNIQPQGEDLRKAVKWVSEERMCDPKKNLNKLLQEAGLKFDLSPGDQEFLTRCIKEEV